MADRAALVEHSRIEDPFAVTLTLSGEIVNQQALEELVTKLQAYTFNDGYIYRPEKPRWVNL